MCTPGVFFAVSAESDAFLYVTEVVVNHSEQVINQRALAATIQAMEVQKMTLSALHTMNVPVENWASAVVNNWQQFAKAG